ncbi:hypothetical protein O6P43_009716 [Quillaja saponaria]|uniref:Uncharacterized protein n=1 Tax=Quillaja saponaria TaxID=32244 RepID=A0AAD7PYX7_QUISA|nr:hypothetical protein O6P43_009716 [Quillaja saponaria]
MTRMTAAMTKWKLQVVQSRTRKMNLNCGGVGMKILLDNVQFGRIWGKDCVHHVEHFLIADMGCVGNNNS